MLIRDASKNDTQKMNKLFYQVDKIHHMAHPEIFDVPIKNVRSNEYLENIMNDQNNKLIVAEEDGQVVGLAKAMIETAPEFPLFVQRKWMLISIIVVEESHRGKGIGKQLLDNLYDWAKKNKISDVELTVFDFNETAFDFYVSNGFQKLKTKMYLKLK